MNAAFLLDRHLAVKMFWLLPNPNFQMASYLLFKQYSTKRFSLGHRKSFYFVLLVNDNDEERASINSFDF